MTLFSNRDLSKLAGLVVLVFVLAPALPTAAGGDVASLCEPTEKIWLNATIRDNDKLISLCSAVPSRGANGLQFRLGRPGQIEMSYPDPIKPAARAFIYRRYTRYRTTYLKLEFSVDGRQYAILEGDSDDSDPKYSATFRIRRIKDETDISSEPLQMHTAPLIMMRLENHVTVKPFDE